MADVEVAQSNKDAAIARQEAETARKEADSFELDIGKAKKGAADANERAAQAEKQAAESNRKAGQEQLARLQLEAKLADRGLTAAQQATMASRLSKFGPRRIDVILFGNTPEISRIAVAIVIALQKAGWTVGNSGSAMAGSASGILIGTHSGSTQDVNAAADSLISALKEAGIASGRLPAYDDNLPAAMAGRWDSSNIAPIRMIVGAKP
jgi:hypothetical protein